MSNSNQKGVDSMALHKQFICLVRHVEKGRTIILKAPWRQGVEQGKPIYAKGEDERKLVGDSQQQSNRI